MPKSESRKQEERTAKRYNGSRSVMSGAGPSRKNDVRNESLLIENKTTGNRSSITIKAKDLEDLSRNAAIEDRMGVLQFDLNGRQYVILRELDFLESIS